MATFDAAPKARNPIISSNFVDANVLRLVEKDMELWEQLCCVFFLIDDYNVGYEKMVDISKNVDPLSKYVQEHELPDWEDKLIEGLCLLQNNEILRNLGITIDDARTKFSTNVRCVSYKINKYAKAFYNLFESLSKKDAERLLDRVYECIPRPDRESLPEEVPLEIHLLWWIREEFIKVSEGKWVLKKLLKILKQMNMSGRDVYATLEEFDDRDNDNGPCHLDHQAKNTEDMRTSGMGNNLAKTDDDDTSERYEIKNGLVIIFNQMKFTGPIEYEYRAGSKIDCRRIVDTFENNFGFETEVHPDLGKQEIYSELDRLRDRGKKYDCVVVFILSHGVYGKIVASDGAECSIETIRSKLCSDSLKNKPKILVIQACQIQALTIDGPRIEQTDLGRFEDFLMLCSTIPGEPAVRDPMYGTWFIKILCEVLVEMQGKPIENSLRKISNRFKTMVAMINQAFVKQVPEHRYTLAKELIFPCRARAANN